MCAIQVVLGFAALLAGVLLLFKTVELYTLWDWNKNKEHYDHKNEERNRRMYTKIEPLVIETILKRTPVKNKKKVTRE